MSVEERLFALAQQCRQQSGDSFLLTPSQLVPRLNSQAPDLHAEIRALAAAFETGAAARIAAAPNPEAEMAVVGSEIAVREKLSMGFVMPALTVARRIGPLTSSYAGTPSPGGWAGDSMAVGAGAARPPPPIAPAAPPQPTYATPQPGAPHPQPAPGMPAQPQSQTDKMKELTKNPLVMGAAALVIGLLVYQNFMQPASQEITTVPIDSGGGGSGGGGVGGGGVPQPPPPGGQTPANNNQMPLLGAPGASAPTLQVARHTSGAPVIGFMLQTQRGAAPGMVVLPNGGWTAGPVGIGLAAPDDPTGQNLQTAGQGQFQLIQSGGHPVRLAQMQMQQDNLGTGNLCLMFRGQQGQQDVQLSGADFCVMDGPCSRPLGCGRLQ